mgnify:CR=1 FL=1
MRIGSNPAKKETKIKINSYHRIIVPIYIPNLTDEYFKKGLEVLKICLESLLLTVHQKTRVSIICNGCCKEVEEYIEGQQSKLPQGLGTGGLFTNNFESPLEVKNGELHYNSNKKWDFNL